MPLLVKYVEWSVCRKMHHGYRCHNLVTGTRRDHCQTTLWISQRSERRGNRTKERYQEQALVMKKTLFLPIKSNKTHHSQVLPLSSTTRTTILQMFRIRTGEAYLVASVAAWRLDVFSTGSFFSFPIFSVYVSLFTLLCWYIWFVTMNLVCVSVVQLLHDVYMIRMDGMVDSCFGND